MTKLSVKQREDKRNKLVAKYAKKHAELKAMAKYIAALPGDLQTVPQSRFR